MSCRPTTKVPEDVPSNTAAPVGRRLLEVDHASVHFGGVNALSDVCLAIEAASTVGIVGPNGAGKTTLFGVMSGLIRGAGRVMLDGGDVSRSGPHVRARLGLARTFQQVELFASVSVYEHLLLARRLARRHGRVAKGTARADAEAIEQLLGGLGLVDVADEDAATLPPGTARLVEVGRALAAGPSVMLLDEPFSGLDAMQRRHLFDVLSECRRTSEIALVLVEHDLDLVLEMSDFIYVLDAGQVISAGLPSVVVQDPAVQSAYIGADVGGGRTRD